MKTRTYGYFDDEKREFVITDPALPWPWMNYLGTEDFFSLISATAGGYCFCKDAKFRRITRYRYNSVPADDGNHSCMADDANDVQFRKTAREDEEGFGSTTPNKKDILWNRPAGNWRIKFYPEIDKDKKDASYYTITGTKVVKMPFTYRVGRFIRTYSNSVAMEPKRKAFNGKCLVVVATDGGNVTLKARGYQLKGSELLIK